DAHGNVVVVLDIVNAVHLNQPGRHLLLNGVPLNAGPCRAGARIGPHDTHAAPSAEELAIDAFFTCVRVGEIVVGHNAVQVEAVGKFTLDGVDVGIGNRGGIGIGADGFAVQGSAAADVLTDAVRVVRHDLFDLGISFAEFLKYPYDVG